MINVYVRKIPNASNNIRRVSFNRSELGLTDKVILELGYAIDGRDCIRDVKIADLHTVQAELFYLLGEDVDFK